jgi:hypothetical protein
MLLLVLTPLLRDLELCYRELQAASPAAPAEGLCPAVIPGTLTAMRSSRTRRQRRLADRMAVAETDCTHHDTNSEQLLSHVPVSVWEAKLL